MTFYRICRGGRGDPLSLLLVENFFLCASRNFLLIENCALAMSFPPISAQDLKGRSHWIKKDHLMSVTLGTLANIDGVVGRITTNC